MKKTLAWVAAVAVCAGSASTQEFDVNGDPIGQIPNISVDGPAGTSLSTITTPVRVVGTAPVNDNIAGIYTSSPSVIYEYTPSGTLVTSIQHSYTSPYGLGFDRKRNQYALVSASSDDIARVDLAGNVTTVFPAPTSAPIGIAYDSIRDAYWVPDWSANVLHLMDATTGLTIQPSFSLAASGCTRSADAGYSWINDMIAIVGRDQNQMFLYRAGNPPTFVTAFSFSTSISARGSAIPYRTQTTWSSHFSGTRMEEYDMGLPRVVAASTVKVGTPLAVQWVAGASPNMPYQAAAAFVEGTIPIGTRFIPLAPDALFFLSLTQPALFQGMAGTLDGSGNANGQVNVPAIPAIAGVPFSLAFVTIDGSAPQGIGAISGPTRTQIVP